MSLVEVEAALEARDLPAALRHALACWRQARHPRVAALIEELSIRVGRTRARPTNHATWLASATRRDPADLAGLLATLGDQRKMKPLLERLAALAGRDDPRIATAMIALLRHPPLAGNTGVAVRNAAVERLLEIADPRSAAALEELEGEYLATVAERLRTPPAGALSEEDERLLAALEARLAEPRDAEALYAAIYANPDDDAPRAVLADLLQERGDPRGELIALQLAREASRGERSPRENALLRTHAREWLGAIAPAVSTKKLHFERGFVARCEVIGPSELADRREWSTVSVVDVRGWRSGLAPLLARMPVLQTLRGLARASLACSHPTIRMIELELLDSAEALVAAELPALCVVDAMKARCPFEDLAVLWSSPRFASLERFVVDADTPADWIPGLAELAGPRLGYTQRTGGPWRLWFVGARVIAEDPRPAVRRGREHSVRLAELLALVPSPATRELAIESEVAPCHELAAIAAQFATVRYAEPA